MSRPIVSLTFRVSPDGVVCDREVESVLDLVQRELPLAIWMDQDGYSLDGRSRIKRSLIAAQPEQDFGWGWDWAAQLMGTCPTLVAVEAGDPGFAGKRITIRYSDADYMPSLDLFKQLVEVLDPEDAFYTFHGEDGDLQTRLATHSLPANPIGLLSGVHYLGQALMQRFRIVSQLRDLPRLKQIPMVHGCILQMAGAPEAKSRQLVLACQLEAMKRIGIMV